MGYRRNNENLGFDEHASLAIRDGNLARRIRIAGAAGLGAVAFVVVLAWFAIDLGMFGFPPVRGFFIVPGLHWDPRQMMIVSGWGVSAGFLATWVASSLLRRPVRGLLRHRVSRRARHLGEPVARELAELAAAIV